MILRSGRVLHNNHIMNPDQENVPAITHRITQRSPQITKFCGRLNGACGDVENFLESLSHHIEAVGIRDEQEKLREAKSYLDLTRGDICQFTQSWKFKEIQTYSEFQEYLRNLYGVVTSTDVVKSLSRIFRDLASSDDSYIELGGSAYQQINAWKQKARGSNWIDDDQISLDDFCIMLHQAITLAHLPQPLVEVMKESWDRTHDLATIRERVQDNIGKVPDLDMSHIIEKRERNRKNVVATVGSNQTSQAQKFVPLESNSKSPINCQKCGRNNHLTKDCYIDRFCSFHNARGHGLADCYAYKRSLQSQPPNHNYNQYRGRSPSPNPNFSNNQYRGRSQSPFQNFNHNKYRGRSHSRPNNRGRNNQSFRNSTRNNQNFQQGRRINQMNP